MDTTSLGSLVYLVLLGGALIASYVFAHRQNMGQMLRNMIQWGLIFIGVIAAVGLWQDIRGDILPQQSVFAEAGRIEVPQARDGHFYITASVNGSPVLFVVDTGATDIVLTRQDAISVGIDPDSLVYSGRAGTANGVVGTARTTVDELSVGGITDQGVSVWVNRGEMNTSLLGMAYLRRFERIEIADNKLVLER
ncbi:retropepsin-like aspartic protease family protein [Psychromarinibacter sp. S121]|uniref:retropepsin-like aspartic protease family protein n=1 Tax=Psychromarinibacter sp. S121 TaxID=3415127 RepID=UPI003C7CB80D